jgi:dsRNA-specific ribonuclease/SAM-dependent methyltransferase
MNDDTISYGKRDMTFRDAIRRLLSISMSEENIDYLLNDKNISYFSTAFTHESASSYNNQNFLRTIGHFSYEKTVIWHLSRTIPNIFTKEGQKIATIFKNNITKDKKLGDFLHTFFGDFLEFLTINNGFLSRVVNKAEILEELCEAIFGAVEFLMDDVREGLGNALMYQLIVAIFEKYMKLTFDTNIDNVKDTKTKLNDIFMRNKASYGKIEYRDVSSSLNVTDIGLYAIQAVQILPNQQAYIIGLGSDSKKIDAEQKAALDAMFHIKQDGIRSLNRGQLYFSKPPQSLSNDPTLTSRPISLCPMFEKVIQQQHPRLYHTFFQTFYRPFHMNDANERTIANSLLKEMSTLISFNVPDQKIYQFLHMRFTQVYLPTYTPKQEVAFTNFNDLKQITSQLQIKSLVDFGTCEYTLTLSKMMGLQKSICMSSVEPNGFTFVEISDAEPVLIEKINNEIDLVTSLTSLHTLLPSRRQEVIRECYRIVKKGGYFLLCEHDINEKDTDAKLFLDMYYNLREMVWAKKRDVQHKNYYQSKEQWTTIIEQAGFTRVKPTFEQKYNANQLQKLYNGHEIQNPYYTYYALYQKI